MAHWTPAIPAVAAFVRLPSFFRRATAARFIYLFRSKFDPVSRGRLLGRATSQSTRTGRSLSTSRTKMILAGGRVFEDRRPCQCICILCHLPTKFDGRKNFCNRWIRRVLATQGPNKLSTLVVAAVQDILGQVRVGKFLRDQLAILETAPTPW